MPALCDVSLQCPKLRAQLTVEARVTTLEEGAEGLQALVSRWSPLVSMDTFDAFDASHTDGLDSTGYFGAVFDGQYVYFVPEKHADQRNHGIVLRYDTHGAFHDPRSYSAYDAGCVAGVRTVGYYGAAFDGTFVYFVPRQLEGRELHSRILRLDTRLEFKNPEAWDAFDAGPKRSWQGAAFDGRYVYLCPGYQGEPHPSGRSSLVMRYDTLADFKSRTSYETFYVDGIGGLDAGCFDGGAFDGRFIYFVPLERPVVVRFDTRGGFFDRACWQAFDAGRVGLGMCVGSVFDGRFLYFVPYSHSVVVRFDVTGDFLEPSSWESFDAGGVCGPRARGFDGGFFDGRQVYFVPFVCTDERGDYVFHCRFLRYDTQGGFGDAASWTAQDASATSGLLSVGYNAGAYDGRFFYAAPWRHAPDPNSKLWGVHGVVLRYDTLGQQGSFSLRYSDYGHNGGLCAAVPGPAFLVNTERGVLNASAHRALRPGRHHLKGTYDGQRIRLFVDGILAAERCGRGCIQENDEPVSLGGLRGGLCRFRGVIEDVRIFDRV
ncbi:MAG: LamG domain-containing protein [Planctomycetes bacterium]|nr:LamG domain-containing protein [Planctomycetota bacterium]